MSPAHDGRLVVAVIGVVAVAVWALGGAGSTGRVAAAALVSERPASPAPEQRAVVVVDTGSTVRSACVRFREASISGSEALRRAGMSPVFRTFGGQGAAVCSLCGKGCPADGSCLTCGGSEYWGYFRQSAGAGGYSYARGGAGSSRVRDGDVEAWRWGDGTALPPAVSVDAVCGPAAAPEPVAAPESGAPQAPSAAASESGPGDVAPASSDPGSVGSTTPSVVVAGQSEQRADVGAVERDASNPQRSSPWPFILTAGGVALGVGALVWLMGRRRIGTSR